MVRVTTGEDKKISSAIAWKNHVIVYSSDSHQWVGLSTVC